jgi:hypothetical protein
MEMPKSLIKYRAIGCDSQMHGRPLATRPIRDDDYLPLEPEFLDGSRRDVMEPTFRYRE